VAIAMSETAGRPHQFRMFEAEPYRLQKSLSDVLGHDPYVHLGRAEGVLEALLNVFSHLHDSPDFADLWRVYRGLRRFREDRLARDVFQPKPFSKLIVAARELAGS
jgi:hypothetical protein